MKPGTQLKDLHNNWAFGSYFLDSLFSGFACNLVALASIAASLTPINGPLLQRASSITSIAQTTSVDLKIPGAQVFPLEASPWEASHL
jgi:hypothetical protein